MQLVGFHNERAVLIRTLAPTTKLRLMVPGLLFVVDGWVGSNLVAFYAVNLETGEEVRKYAMQAAIYSSPAVTEGIVYFGSLDNYLHAVDSQTGQEVWRFETGGRIEASSPVFANGLVYFMSADSNLYALDGQTGQEEWRFQVMAGAYLTPAVTDGVVYVSKLFDLIAVQAPGE